MYCSVEDIALRIGHRQLVELTNEDTNQTQYNEPLITEIIIEQSRYMDSYISGRYLLPIVNTEDLKLLKPFCVELVIEKLYSRRLIELPDPIISKKKAVVSDLEKIQKGIITLYSSNDSELAINRVSVRRVSKTDRYFTDEVLRKY